MGLFIILIVMGFALLFWAYFEEGNFKRILCGISIIYFLLSFIKPVEFMGYELKPIRVISEVMKGDDIELRLSNGDTYVFESAGDYKSGYKLYGVYARSIISSNKELIDYRLIKGTHLRI